MRTAKIVAIMTFFIVFFVSFFFADIVLPDESPESSCLGKLSQIKNRYLPFDPDKMKSNDIFRYQFRDDFAGFFCCYKDILKYTRCSTSAVKAEKDIMTFISELRASQDIGAMDKIVSKSFDRLNVFKRDCVEEIESSEKVRSSLLNQIESNSSSDQSCSDAVKRYRYAKWELDNYIQSIERNKQTMTTEGDRTIKGVATGLVIFGDAFLPEKESKVVQLYLEMQRSCNSIQ